MNDENYISKAMHNIVLLTWSGLRHCLKHWDGIMNDQIAATVWHG